MVGDKFRVACVDRVCVTQVDEGLGMAMQNEE